MTFSNFSKFDFSSLRDITVSTKKISHIHFLISQANKKIFSINLKYIVHLKKKKMKNFISN